jgi:hypothetical protein
LCELQDDSVTSVNWIQRVSSYKRHSSPIPYLRKTGFTSRRGHKSRAGPDLGCPNSASPAYHDGPYGSGWRSCLE